jgi:U4/U6.U5 tri-snRNP component SNU23
MSERDPEKAHLAETDDSFRRKWDKDEYEKLAQKYIREDEEKFRGVVRPGKPIERSLLKARDYKVNVEDKLGKIVVVTKDTPLSQSGGFYCNVCDCVIKDSTNFFDHINGRKHQKNLGMSMRVQKSTLSQVQQRLKKVKDKQELKQRAQDIDYEAKLRAAEGATQRAKEERKKRKEVVSL